VAPRGTEIDKETGGTTRSDRPRPAPLNLSESKLVSAAPGAPGSKGRDRGVRESLSGALPTAASNTGPLSDGKTAGSSTGGGVAAGRNASASASTRTEAGAGGEAAPSGGRGWWKPSCFYQTVDPSVLETVLYQRLDSFRQVRRFAHSHDPSDPTDKQLTLLETLDVNLQDVRANTEVIIEWLVGTGGEDEDEGSLGGLPGGQAAGDVPLQVPPISLSRPRPRPEPVAVRDLA